MVLPNKENVEHLLKEGNLKYDEGKYEDAIEIYEKAYLPLATSYLNIAEKCEILLGMIKAHYQLNQLVKAKKYYEEAISFIRNRYNDSVRFFKAEFYAVEGKICLKEKKYEVAVSKLTQAIDYSNLKTSNILIPQIHSDLAKAYTAQHDYENAKKTLTTSLVEQLQNLKNTSEISRSFLDSFHLVEPINSKSLIEKLNRLVLRLKTSLGKNTFKSLQIALIFDTIGSIFYLNYLYSLAVDCYKTAEEIKIKLFASKDNYRRLISAEYLSKAYFAYAESDHSQLKEAAKYYKRVISIMQSSKTDDKILIAQVKITLGEIDFKEKKYKGSRDYYKVAQRILQEIDHEDLDTTIELSNTHYGIAMVHLQDNKLHLAMKSFQKSLDLVKGKLKGKDRILKADIMDKIAEIHRQQHEMRPAKEMYREAIKIRTDICHEEGLDFAQSYYNRQRLERYRPKIFDTPLKDDQQPKYFGMVDKASREKAIIYKKIAKIYKFLEEDKHALSYYNKAKDEYLNLEGNYDEDLNMVQNAIDILQNKRPSIINRSVSKNSFQPWNSQSQSGKNL